MGLVLFKNPKHVSLEVQIASLENDAEYPLGTDYFRIDHGQDYFAFFRRLGKVNYYVWQEEGQAAAVAAAVIRPVPLNNQIRNTWYLCDLKVHPRFRGMHLPVRMLKRSFLPAYLRCSRGYAISMNPGDGSPNRVARILSHFWWAPLRVATKLLIWSMDADAMKSTLPTIEKHRGPTRFLSLQGIKDIVLKSTGSPMNLLHAQHGKFAAGDISEPISGYTHMICSPEEDPLSKELIARGFEPSASATIIAHRMSECDWTWVLTSDI